MRQLSSFLPLIFFVAITACQSSQDFKIRTPAGAAETAQAEAVPAAAEPAVSTAPANEVAQGIQINAPGAESVTLPDTPENRERLAALIREAGATAPAAAQPSQTAAPNQVADSGNIWSDVREVMDFGSSTGVANAIESGRGNANASSARLCYRAAKYHMCKPSQRVTNYRRVPSINGQRCEAGALVKRSPSGIAAFQAEDQLKREPNYMIDLMETPCRSKINGVKDAPKGAIIVYDSIRAGTRNCMTAPTNNLQRVRGKTMYGHIEIKGDWGDSGAYYSDFTARNSILRDQNSLCGLRWRVRGIMINVPQGTRAQDLCRSSRP